MKKLLFDTIRLSVAEIIFEKIQTVFSNELSALAGESNQASGSSSKSSSSPASASSSASTSGSVALSVQSIYESLVEPPNPEMGDLAFGCFPMAKLFKKAPPAIAASLSSADFTQVQFIEKAQPVGPYLNFFLKPEFIGQKLLTPILDGRLFSEPLVSHAPKTMIEFSQPNTHKELHVGHMRNACLGDSIVRLHRYAGFEVVSTTFPGDVGTHVAKCLWYLKYHNQESMPEVVVNAKPLANGRLPAEALIARGEWIGKMYSKGNLKLEDEVGTPQEAENRKVLTEILHQLEKKQGEFYDLWVETRRWSVELMEYVYQWSNIQFDKWYWESDVDSDSVKYIKSLYSQGLLIESQGAIGMDLSEEKLGFCLLLKSDGTGLYATKDIELARRKFQEHKIEKSLYVVDMRQALHFQQVFKVLEKIGFPQAKQCFHLQYNFVELPDGAMSSRKGNIVPLIQLVHRMEKMVKEKYLSRYAGEWTIDEVDLVATQVAQGAIKYGMLRMDSNKKIVFDMEEWLKLDGESGPFIQYAKARIQSLSNKLGYNSTTPVQWSLLVHPAEKKLLQKLMHFQSVIMVATEQYRPSVLCTYLYELAKAFNLFYHEVSIGQAETLQLKNTRLALSQATGAVIDQGLGLLGIPSPLKM